MHLRRRLNTVLLQWFLLLVVFGGAVWAISLPGIRRDVVDERALLARTLAHSIDATIASSLQSLDRLSTEVSSRAEVTSASLRPFRFESPFGEAIYVLDSRGRVLAADPADVEPIDRMWLGDHELVTPAVRRPGGDDDRMTLAMVQPFRRTDRQYFLVAEMNPAASRLTGFLKDLQPAGGLRVDIVDAHGLIIASADPAQVLRPVPDERRNGGVSVRAPLQYAPWTVVIQQRNAEAVPGLHIAGRGLLFTGVGLALIGVVFAGLQTFNQRLEEQVAARTAVIVKQDQQRKVLVRRMLMATEDERRRVARELHDEIAQLLTVIQFSLHKIGVESPDIDRANQLLAKTQQEIHRLIHDLRPALLDDLGLATAMRAYADDHLRRQGLSVTLDVEDGQSAQPEIDTVVFRIYQELVTNILRHAHAENVSVELHRTGGRLILDVEDDGDGFDPGTKSGSAGLTGMRERAALVNGTITFDSAVGEGTHVRVEIPSP